MIHKKLASPQSVAYTHRERQTDRHTTPRTAHMHRRAKKHTELTDEPECLENSHKVQDAADEGILVQSHQEHHNRDQRQAQRCWCSHSPPPNTVTHCSSHVHHTTQTLRAAYTPHAEDTRLAALGPPPHRHTTICRHSPRSNAHVRLSQQGPCAMNTTESMPH